MMEMMKNIRFKNNVSVKRFRGKALLGSVYSFVYKNKVKQNWFTVKFIFTINKQNVKNMFQNCYIVPNVLEY